MVLTGPSPIGTQTIGEDRTRIQKDRRRLRLARLLVIMSMVIGMAQLGSARTGMRTIGLVLMVMLKAHLHLRHRHILAIILLVIGMLLIGTLPIGTQMIGLVRINALWGRLRLVRLLCRRSRASILLGLPVVHQLNRVNRLLVLQVRRVLLVHLLALAR